MLDRGQLSLTRLTVFEYGSDWHAINAERPAISLTVNMPPSARALGRIQALMTRDTHEFGSPHVTQSIHVTTHAKEIRLFIVAGDFSGDALGAKLMAAINAQRRGRVRYLGVGGEGMATQGLASQFPLADIVVMGPLSILPKLPKLVSRVYRTVDAAITAEPDCVVIIDAPEFTHPIAKRIRAKNKSIPIINYVSPSVWAWRPGRAKRMRKYIDHVMAILPFEPAVHDKLEGPPCTYVGHPLIEQLDRIASLDTAPLATRLGLHPDRPVLVVLPGSRMSEVARLMKPFGDAIDRLIDQGSPIQVLIPTLPHLRFEIEKVSALWRVRPHIVESEDDKFRAFKLATVALAASGTVTLELALAGTPMVVGYRVDGLAKHLRFLVKTPSIVLANLVADDTTFPEFIQEQCNGPTLAAALAPLLELDSPERRKQLATLATIPERMRLQDGTPSAAAAAIVLRYAELAGR
jgi:lipid-A-disaccharide synthase